MSFEKICQLAEEFILKLAFEQAPPEVKVEDLDWVDEETKKEIRANKDNEEYLPFDKPHNPPTMIKDKSIWTRAKKAVKPWKAGYSNWWPVVFSVYRKMGGKVKHKKKH